MQTFTVSGYPQHETAVSALPDDQQVDLARVAVALVGTLLAGQGTQVVVEGFADSDQLGDDFEFEISWQRAQNVTDFLQDGVMREAELTQLDETALRRLNWSQVAYGDNRKVYEQPADEDERLVNRRVNVIVESAPLPPFDCSSGASAALELIDGVETPGPQRRLRCMLEKMRDRSDVMDGYYSYDDLVQSIPGNAGWPDLTPDQFAIAAKATTKHVCKDLRNIMMSDQDDDKIAGLIRLDDNIGRNLYNFEAQLNAGNATGRLVLLYNQSITQLQMNERSVLSCYAGYGRAHHDD
jgi:hypothetical protein